jgi:hypothetical protein
MTLQFIGDAGIYIPKADAIKITAVHGSAPVACYIKRSALVALGCGPYDDPAAMLEVFEKNRTRTEKVAAGKFASGNLMDVTVSADDLLDAR